MIYAVLVALGLWASLLLAPWQAWRCREHLEPEPGGSQPAPDNDLTILIPARNEARVIGATLTALAIDAPGIPLVLVDDESTDDTTRIARKIGGSRLQLIQGTPTPPGWAGKLWALEQGMARITTPWVLLLDADIRLAPGMIRALRRKAEEGYSLVSVLAHPRFEGFWARLLLPAYVFFFKLVYPFALSNRPRGSIAAAAGGVVLLRCETLAAAGGFSAWRDALIDDCTLAARIKRHGEPIWLGLTRGAHSLRRQGFAAIASMVARSAYVQLHESALLLFATTLLMLFAFWIPLVALTWQGPTRWMGVAALAAMGLGYLPTLRYYHRRILGAGLLPAVASIYLVFTWYSALRAWSGTRSSWKGRYYRREED